MQFFRTAQHKLWTWVWPSCAQVSATDAGSTDAGWCMVYFSIIVLKSFNFKSSKKFFFFKVYVSRLKGKVIVLVNNC